MRDDELTEMSHSKAFCPLEIKSPVETTVGKANLMLQAYISGHHFSSFTLISDSGYISQNAGRITRALFELCLKRDWPTLADQMLTICKAVDQQLWWFQTPLRQFRQLDKGLCRKLEESTRARKSAGSGANAGSAGELARLLDLDARELGQLVNHHRAGPQLHALLRQLPAMEMEASIQVLLLITSDFFLSRFFVSSTYSRLTTPYSLPPSLLLLVIIGVHPSAQPITSGILRVTLLLTPAFEWSDRIHGSVEPWWVWVEDGENEHIYHSEYVCCFSLAAD